MLDRKELIEKLKLEIEVIEKGGYYPSVRDPRRELRIFRDSVSCLNVGLEEKKYPCTHCFLMEFVPPEYRNAADPCAYIPLNERGDSIASLEAAGDRDRLREALLGWLRSTIARLEAEA